MAINVLIVDDSAFMRQLIREILESDPDIKVVGVAADGEDALKKIKLFRPQVVTLDLKMPRMDGLTCLAEIMESNPVPVVVISSWALEGAEETFKALELGAVDFITKPDLKLQEDLWNLANEIIRKVKTAALVKPQKIKEIPYQKEETLSDYKKENNYEVLSIGASTGGPRAIQFILTHLPPDFPLGILIAQHMPEEFIRIFAARLDGLGPLRVKVAADGDLVSPGQVLVAPYGRQTGVVKDGDEIRIKLTMDDNIYKPSIDHMFKSVAEIYREKTISVLLTGMGSDGAEGLKIQRNLGCRTIAEAEESCVIYGMPRAAVSLGAAEFITPLSKIPKLICNILSKKI